MQTITFETTPTVKAVTDQDRFFDLTVGGSA
jgi:hypothetical protein